MKRVATAGASLAGERGVAVNEAGFAILMLLVLAWAVFSHLLAAVNITGPLVLLVAGYLLGNPSWGPLTVDVDAPSVHLLAEVTLALLLFADASRVNVAQLRQDVAFPARLLGLGLPMSIILGALAAALLFDDMSWALAGFVGATLAPTDAALSAQVVNDERIPLRLRRALNVESGLNDGIATPIVVFTLAVVATDLGLEGHGHDGVAGALLELALGVVVGLAVGLVSAVVIGFASRRRWVATGGRRLATLAAALTSFSLSGALDGNGFIAAFVAGIAFGAAVPKELDVEELGELPELMGELLALAVWFLFGAALLPVAFDHFSVSTLAYAAAQPDRDPDGPRRPLADRHGHGQAHRAVRGLVRAARTGVGRVRAAGGRGARRGVVDGRGDRGGRPDRADERRAPRRLGRPVRQPVRPSGGTPAGVGGGRGPEGPASRAPTPHGPGVAPGIATTQG